MDQNGIKAHWVTIASDCDGAGYVAFVVGHVFSPLVVDCHERFYTSTVVGTVVRLKRYDRTGCFGGVEFGHTRVMVDVTFFQCSVGKELQAPLSVLGSIHTHLLGKIGCRRISNPVGLTGFFNAWLVASHDNYLRYLRWNR